MIDRAPPLQVLMINTHANAGGAARMASALVRAINATGAVDARLYHSGDRIVAHPLYGIRRLGSRQLNAILARFGGSLAVLDMGLADQVVARSRDADVIHLHNLHGYYLEWDRLLRGIRDRPIVWTWHDMWGITGRCGHASGCEGWRTGCRPCPHLEYYPSAWIDRAGNEYRHKGEWLARLKRLIIVTPSEWLRQAAIDRGIAAERVVCVPNPVDVSVYQPTATAKAREHLGLNPDERHLLFVAANCDNPLKGYRDFLRTVRHTGWRGLVAGGEPNEMPSDVRYLGSFIDPHELSLCYSAADALLVPSRFDNAPNTVIESMACGTPVFGYASGGVPLQMHAIWGGVVKTGDTEALAALLSSQMDGHGKTDTMINQVREHAISHWAASRIANQYIELYRRVMAS